MDLTDISFYLKLVSFFMQAESKNMERDIGVCGIAVLDNFSCVISVILILNCGITVFSKSVECDVLDILDGIKKLSFKSSNVFQAFSSFRSFHFLIIISEHATGCSLVSLFCLKHFQILISVSVLFALNLLKYSAAVSVWHRISTRYCSIAVFGDFFFFFFCYMALFVKFFCGIVVFRTPQCPPQYVLAVLYKSIPVSFAF